MRSDLAMDLSDRLAWLYGNPGARMEAMRGDRASWDRLGFPAVSSTALRATVERGFARDVLKVARALL